MYRYKTLKKHLRKVFFAMSVISMSKYNDLYPAPATAGAAPPKKKAPRSECAIDTDRELPVFAASNRTFPMV